MDLSKKISTAVERIKFGAEANRGEPLYLCQSGGKDSACIEQLAKEAGVDFTSNYNVTGIDHPELVYHLRRNYPNTIFHHPEKTIFKYMMEKMWPPQRSKRWCCELLKEGRGYGVVVIGIRWAESYRRKKRRWIEVCSKDEERQYLSPIIDWDDADIWNYIRDRGIETCSLYGPPHNYRRLGCIMCPMSSSATRKREAAMYPGYARLFRLWLGRLLEERELSGKTNHNFIDADDFFAWWIEDKMAISEARGQLCIAFDN